MHFLKVMTTKFLNYFSRTLIVPILLITPIKSKAQQLDSTTWYSYGFGAGVSATLCDQVDAGLITNLEARMFTSNFEQSLEDEQTANAFDVPALVEGFNIIVPEFDNCKIKLN